MRAVVLGHEETVHLADVPDPELIDPGDAIVTIRRAAICGSDLHVINGRIPGMLPGGVLGHEFTGVVEAVGADVTNVAVGDRVVGSFLIPCGRCEDCHRRAYNHCEEPRVLGYGMFFGDLAGAQAERVRVPNATLSLLRIPEGLDDEQVLFVGDILATAYYVNVLGEVGPGATVAVQGCGPIGILAIQIAAARGADRIAAVDVSADRLVAARAHGALPVDVSGTNAGVAIEEVLGGGADVVLDTAGGPSEVLAQTFELVRRGGTIAVVGVYSDFEATIPLNDLWLKGIALRFGGICPVPALWHDVLAMVADTGIDPTAIISHRLPLEEAVEGYRLFAAHEALKVVLQVSEPNPG